MRNRLLKILLKLTVVLVSYAYLVYKFRTYRLDDFQLAFERTGFVYLVIVLMFVNWSVETLKWRFLLKNIEYLSFAKAFRGVLIGITFGLFTPNRIGELAGRVVLLHKENRIKSIFATSAGSLGQLSITMLSGMLGALILVYELGINSSANPIKTLLLITTATVLSLCIILIFFNLKHVTSFFLRFKLFAKQSKSLQVLADFSKPELFRILILSAIRYAVFTTQYALLLQIFKIELSVFQMFSAVSLTFFVMASVPVFTLAELGIRGSVSLFFFGLFSTDEPGIIAATTLLWIINVAIPALLGSIFFFLKKSF